ncbi:ribulose bisphosphate carboxylase small subunit [Paraburkholderia sp. JPY158]|uniref:Ribulose bisphosphate carboxylase small subunit n=1 Tax=Paraburkholderia atlantica TaxID=2654982 RepID=A0A7W8QFJ2_PARAM|nr:ribulose bisphosphate carboxylase small subunit [Paraburkholderia atlantica]
MWPDGSTAICFVECVIRDIAGLGHGEIAEIGGLRNNHRHQAVRVGDLLRVTGLQGRHRRQEAATLIHKPDDVGNVA